MSDCDLLFDLSCLQKKFARKKFRKQIFEAWGCCCYCGKENPTTLDHVIPKARGGSTTKANLVACCGDCNISKNHEEVLMWWRSKPFWTIEREQNLFLWLAKYHPITLEREEKFEAMLRLRSLPQALA